MLFHLDPQQGDIKARRNQVGDIYSYLIHCSELSEKTGKPFQVEFSDKKKSKSFEQIKGVHLLCTKLIPHLSKAHEANYCLKDVKDYVKREFDYMRAPTRFEAGLMLKSVSIELTETEKKEAYAFCKKVRQPKSFADASKDEMMKLITEIEAWAASKSWEDVFLDPIDKQKLVNFYEDKG